MKNKILLGVVVILSIILLLVVNKNHFFSFDKTIKVKTNDEIKTIELEEYLVGVLAAEMPASFLEEALKAQAVASRTYAMYKILHNKNEEYDILSDITHQSYITKEEMQEKWQSDYDTYLKKITDAIKKTEKEVLYYNDEIIEAFYFSMSNGKTEDAEYVFGTSLPYISVTNSSWDNENLNNFLVTKEISKDEFCTLLNLDKCENIKIGNINYTGSDRINELTINNKVFKGTEIRKLLSLRSTDFQINIDNDKIIINTKGYGHGVGMSQYGANGMAKEGYNYQEILKYYYNDVTIKKVV